MVAAITALFFACAAAFAVWVITRMLTGSVDRMDELFAQYRALGSDTGRVATGRMKPVVRFMPSAAPNFAPRNVVTMPLRKSAAPFSPADWRAAA